MVDVPVRRHMDKLLTESRQKGHNMKKLNFALAIMIGAFLCLPAGVSFAASIPPHSAGSWAETDTTLSAQYHLTTLDGVADSTGAFSVRSLTQFIRGQIVQVVTDPDTTINPAIADSVGRFPSDNYDIVINAGKIVASTGTALDVMGGALANRDTNSTEMVTPKNSTNIEYPFFNTFPLKIVVTGNIIPNARIHIKILWLAR